VTVTEVIPVAEEVLEVSVKTLLVVVLGGLNAAETPVGKPVAVNATLPLNPFCGTTVMVVVTDPPWPTLGLFGVADSVKLGGGFVPPPPPLLLPPPHAANATASAIAMPEHSPRTPLTMDDSRQTRIQNAHESLLKRLRCEYLATTYFACG
jgi:hypothetical protein